jgi:hypothetical protein
MPRPFKQTKKFSQTHTFSQRTMFNSVLKNIIPQCYDFHHFELVPRYCNSSFSPKACPFYENSFLFDNYGTSNSFTVSDMPRTIDHSEISTTLYNFLKCKGASLHLICLITTTILLLVLDFNVMEMKISFLTLYSDDGIPTKKEVWKNIYFRQS